MIDQCLPYPGELERDWLLWVELWLSTARRPELRETAARLYGRMHSWFAEAIADGIAAGEFTECDADALADRARGGARRVRDPRARARPGSPDRPRAARGVECGGAGAGPGEQNAFS